MAWPKSKIKFKITWIFKKNILYHSIKRMEKERCRSAWVVKTKRRRWKKPPLCSSSGMIPMWCVYLSSRLVWLVTKMMTIGPENMDHENNDPAAGQASIPAILFWEQNIPKLPNIQDVYCCTSTLHCQTPLWCALLLSSEAPLPAYAKVLTSGKKKKQLSFSASSKFAKRFNNRPEI